MYQDCPAFRYVDGYNPEKIYEDILSGGDIAKWLASEMIWQCLECHTCSELCPQNYSWEMVVTILKHEAILHGFAAKTTKRSIEYYLKTGLLGEVRESARKKMGLNKAPKPGTDEFVKLVKIVRGMK